MSFEACASHLDLHSGVDGLGTRQVTKKLLVRVRVYTGCGIVNKLRYYLRDKQKYASMMRLALLHVLYILGYLTYLEMTRQYDTLFTSLVHCSITRA